MEPQQTRVTYQPVGAARDLFVCKDPEIILSGPAGTGKSRSCLEKLHLVLSKYPKARALMVRKTLASLTSTGIVTYTEKVLHPLDGVKFFGGNKVKPAQYEYPNGSVLVVGGMDKPTKIMSSEYDIIYCQEAIELSENDWESLTTRLRNGVMPYQQIIADTNPDAPTHWIKRRADSGLLRMMESRHEDNLRLYRNGEWTAEGKTYIERLDNLTGIRKDRLRYGRWVAAEGVIYDNWDRRLHLLDQFEIPADWRRIRVIDFGFTNPFVCQWWAIDPDGRLYLYREIYMSSRLVSDHAERILELSGNASFEATIADHDAEDRATLHAKGVPSIAARKEVIPGIQAMQQRLRVAEDGKPRLFLLRDVLVERDNLLAEAGKPLCTEQEIDGYVWAPNQLGKAVKEEPLKVNDHGMDAMRYAVAYLDKPTTIALFAPQDVQAASQPTASLADWLIAP